MSKKRLRALVVSAPPANDTLSYQLGWPKAFDDHPDFEPTPFRAFSGGLKGRFERLQMKLKGFDVVILLHSVFSNSQKISAGLADWIAASRIPVVLFLGNEYKLMPKKLAFAETIGTALLVSQSDDPGVIKRYQDRLGCKACGIPNTGLDEAVFTPGPPLAERETAWGFRGGPGPEYLGHWQRVDLPIAFEAACAKAGVSTDISAKSDDRFGQVEWAAFLKGIQAIPGCEAGGDYVDFDDKGREAVNTLLRAKPDASRDEIGKVLEETLPEPQPLRCISGRHIEALGSKTVQALVRGRYNGFLEAGRHYLPLEPDLSNADEVVAMLQDIPYCQQMVDRTFDEVKGDLTYPALVSRLASEIRGVI
ncbi:MAG: hypothetical protein ACPGOV_04170 [Magnetovibrionaceae bacterium]